MGEERRGVAAGTRRTEGISGAAGTCWRSWKSSLSICLSVRNGVASERASPDTREVRSAMTSAMSRARRENRSERRRRKGSSWGRGEGRFRREADKRASTRGERRGEDGGEREGKRVDSLVAWTAELSVEEEEGCMPSYCQRASERISRTERGRKRGRKAGGARTAERKVPLSSKLEGGAVRIV